MNVGIVLRELPDVSEVSTRKIRTAVRFMQDWKRIRNIDPDADVDLLESFGKETTALLLAETNSWKTDRSVLDLLADTLSNSIQITDGKEYLAENFDSDFDYLFSSYIESAPDRAQSVR